MKKTLKVFGFLALAAILVAACAPAPADPAQSAQPAVDFRSTVEEPPTEDQPTQAAPDEEQTTALPDWYSRELTDVNTGMVFRVADFQGKVVLVETMAIWCPKCLSQQQEVNRLHDLLGEREDFVSLGINTDPNEDVSQLTAYVKNNGFDWLYVVASSELINQIGELYGPQFLNPPSTPMFIIDKQGEAHLLDFGLKSAESLQSSLQPFLDEG